MTDNRLLPLDLIDPPLHPLRTSIDEEAMQRLCASIRNQGLIQPVVVRDTQDGRFRLIAGSRRMQAHALLDMAEIECKVMYCSDQAEEEMLLSENLHREDMAPLDEANWLKGHMERWNLNVAQIALRVDCSEGRIYGLLSLLSGDPAVSEALGRGQISKAQAFAINRIADPPGREMGLHWAVRGLMAADSIKAWADERERKGIDTALRQEDWESAAMVRQETKNLAKCVLHEDWVEYSQANWITVCTKCWNAVLAAVEYCKANEIFVTDHQYPRRDDRIEHGGHGGRPFKDFKSDEIKEEYSG